MKICIYTIAKNEQKHVKQWLDTTALADVRVVADTGSSDHTVAMLKEAGVKVVNFTGPFRFDHARNFALDAIPQDVDLCFVNDMDETIRPGWRSIVEQSWKEHPNLTRIIYHYNHVLDANGNPTTSFLRDAIHSRQGYEYRYAAHEVIAPKKGFKEGIVECPTLQQDHHHPETVSRGYYLPLLEISAEENPVDPRAQFVLGREYFRRKEFEAAEGILNRYLGLSNQWPPERAAVLRYLSDIDAKLGNQDQRLKRLGLACEVFPEGRESWWDLANACVDNGMLREARAAIKRALMIPHPIPISFTDKNLWNGSLLEPLLEYVEQQIEEAR